jgi:hypothetical protein
MLVRQHVRRLNPHNPLGLRWCYAAQILLGAVAILLCILLVVYFVASRPKNDLAADEGRQAVQEALAKLLVTTKQAQQAPSTD